jgi:UDP-N-acetyl-D-glucosamine dehydrogenase
MQKTTLIESLKNKNALIGIIGLGYVGLPLVLRYIEVGYKVIGIDVDADKVERLKKGESYIKHIGSSSIAKAMASGLYVTCDFTEACKADALIICVPTPLNKYREPDLSFVIGTMEALLPYVRAGQVVSLESTTYPGTTEEELKPRLESKNLKIGEDVFLIFSPEREDPGNVKFNTKTTPKVCGGATPACLEVGLALYEQVIDYVHPVSSTKAAEMTKLLENIHRAVNIGLVNEIKIICDKIGIDVYEVIRAAATKPFGFVPYYPGPGLGGHCIPIDPFYLTWKAREYGLHTRFIELAGEVNSSMPAWVVEKLMFALNDRKQHLKGSKVLVLGIAYKENIDDMRESPALEIMKLLTEKGASIEYSDPYISKFPKLRKHNFELVSVNITPENLRNYDAVIIVTAHKNFDFTLIKEHAKLIIDTRGVYKVPADNIAKA